MMQYIIGIDQSTQGTKALLFDREAHLLDRVDLLHEQKISSEGYVSHDPEEIWRNTVLAVRKLLTANQITAEQVEGIGISNQRETTVAWDRQTGKPVCDAIVWQCARAQKQCHSFDETVKERIRLHTGIPLSPYFPAAKMAWILENEAQANVLAARGQLCFGTMDSWLIYKMSAGTRHRTDYSNASRTQLFNLHTLSWDEEICRSFGIPVECLAQVCDCDSLFTMTDLDGTLSRPVPVHAVLGDSHGALYGQGCHENGQVKATYGTGSSLMMHAGSHYIESKHGIVTSLAWRIDGKISYVLEGNLNYTGAVITWLKQDLELIKKAGDTQELAWAANRQDKTYLVPAFSGLGAPYWKSKARAMLYGMNRTTGRKEIVRAALDCIAYQITDVLKAMEQDSGIPIRLLSADGGPTANTYLMQFQSDMAQAVVRVPDTEELSGIGAAYLAGISIGLYSREKVFSNLHYREYKPAMENQIRQEKYNGWLEAVRKVIH